MILGIRVCNYSPGYYHPDGARSDIPFCPYPANYQIITPIRSLQVPRNLASWSSHWLALCFEHIYPGQAYTLVRPTDGGTALPFRSTGHLGFRVYFLCSVPFPRTGRWQTWKDDDSTLS